MTPEYLNELADMVDPDELWRINPLEQINLSPELRKKLDAGVALRRHAEHVRLLGELLGTGRSLVTTPLSKNSTASMTIQAPAKHCKLLALRQAQQTRQSAGEDHANP